MTKKIVPFLILIMVQCVCFAQEKFSPIIVAKVLIISPVGGSLEFIPTNNITIQATYQKSVWREGWRGTVDLKFFPAGIFNENNNNKGFYLGPYFRYKDVMFYQFPFLWTYEKWYPGLSGYFWGINFGAMDLYPKHFAMDIVFGIGYARSTGLSNRFPESKIDLRAGLSIGLWRELGKK